MSHLSHLTVAMDVGEAVIWVMEGASMDGKEGRGKVKWSPVDTGGCKPFLVDILCQVRVDESG